VPCCVDERGRDPVPEHDSPGELVFLAAETYRYTGDRRLLEDVWPHVERSMAYLESLPDASLGGAMASQVIEHFEPSYLIRLLPIILTRLRPAAPLVLETINPACWFAFFESYIRDLTHVRPVHPDTLKYLMIATGFQHVDIRYRAPYPESEKLQPIAAGSLGDLAETLNANVEKINRLLFTYLDYAAIGIRG